MGRIDAYRSSEKENVEMTCLGAYENVFIVRNSSAGRCSMKGELCEPMNLGKTTENGPILKVD